VISAAVEFDRGPSAPVAFAVPQFHAANAASLAAQIYGSGLAAGGDSLGYLEFIRLAITVVNHNVLELDSAPANPELDLAEGTRRSAHRDIVVIRAAIHVSGAQEAPAAVPPAPLIPLIPLALPGLRKQEQQYKAAKCNHSCDSHMPPLERCRPEFRCGAGV
jgi:hypothetical protein